MTKSKTLKPTIDQKRIRPFTPLANILSDDFKDLCKKLLFLIRENGVSQVRPDFNNREQLLEFAKYVHQGWKEAQSLIIERVLNNLSEIERLDQKLKDFRRARNKDGVQKINRELNRLKTENTVMRRMIDAIAWAIFKNELSTIRRLSTKGAQTNFSAFNIKDALSTIELYNQNDHLMALCCDLSTFIHVGDILLFDYEKGLTFFVELKSGEKNMALTKIAEAAAEVQCPIFEDEIKKEMSEKEHKQFKRLKKQVEVGNAITNTLNNEKGTDHNTGGGVRIFTTSHEPHSYGSKIVSCYGQLNEKKTWAIDSIDDCLHLGVYTNVDQAFVAFNGWMDMMKCTSTIYNITDSFRTPAVTPFAALNLPTELLEKVIQGEITIILCLDVARLVEMTNSTFPDFLTYADKKASADADRKFTLPLKLDNKALLANGGIVGQGLADRIIFDLQRPKQVIKMFYEMITSK